MQQTCVSSNHSMIVTVCRCNADSVEAYDVFISYSWKREKKIVEKIRDRLNVEGFQTWFDEDAMGEYQLLLSVSCNS